MDELEQIKQALRPTLSEAGYELYETSLSKDRNGLTLHICVDRPEPISIDDIVKVSEIINPLLDRIDPIKEPYTLDVSSLGLEKPLKVEDLEKYVGKYVNLHLTNPYKGLNFLEGDLIEANESEIKIAIREKTRRNVVAIKRADIDRARLAIKF